MAKTKMKAMKMTFRELNVDENGNLIVNKKTGDPTYQYAAYIVRHNAAYFPSK